MIIKEYYDIVVILTSDTLFLVGLVSIFLYHYLTKNAKAMATRNINPAHCHHKLTSLNARARMREYPEVPKEMSRARSLSVTNWRNPNMTFRILFILIDSCTKKKGSKIVGNRT